MGLTDAHTVTYKLDKQRRFTSLLVFFFFFGQAACGLLVPGPGTEAKPPTLEVWHLNHWMAREVPTKIYCIAQGTIFNVL